MIQDLKITTLVDNTTLFGSHYWAEHGLSILIEADGRRILFDTGQTPEVIGHNLDELDIELDDLEHVVISHGHYDHTGGLEEIMKRTSRAKIFAHPDIFDDKYGRRDDKFVHIGIPFDGGRLREEYDFILSKDPIEILEGVRTTGQIPRTTPFESLAGGFYVKEGEEFIEEDILDDQALILETTKGIWVILGCTHSGIVNTLNRVAELTGGKRVAGIIGGTHLIDADNDRLENTLQYLQSLDNPKIGLSHCSGTRAFILLSKVLGNERVFLNHVGSVTRI